MKTATVQDLQHNSAGLLHWISEGEEILITRQGKVIARLSPETGTQSLRVDWANSPEVLRDRSEEPIVDPAELLAETGRRE